MVAHWTFDELVNDTIFDHSQNANHGTNYGATLVPGILGNALLFDGVGDNFNTGYLDGVEMTGRRYSFGGPSYSQFFEDAVVHQKM